MVAFLYLERRYGPPNMTHDPDSRATLNVSNAARMVINAIATETGPLTDTELFLAGCELGQILSAIPNVMDVGEQKVDIPRALHAVSQKGPDDAQRIGVEQLAMQWRAMPCVVELPDRMIAVLKLQLEYILANQGSRETKVSLTLTPNCAEAVTALTSV